MKKCLRKLLAVVLVAVMVCACMPAASASAAEPEFNVAITANMSKATYGDTVTFTLAIKDITASGGLLSVDVPFRFDTNVFEFVGQSSVYPSVWQNPQDFSYTTPKNGLLWLRVLEDNDNFSSTAGCSEDRAICFKVSLRVKSGAPLGDTTVTTNGDGVFEVACGTCADGQCTTALGKGESFTFAISDVGSDIGDVNGDGNVDNMDASIILRYDAGIIELTGSQLKSGDVNGSGTTDNVDAARILQYDAGIIDSF